MPSSKISRDFINFNKEILLGEVGAVLCAPWLAFLISKITSVSSTISIFAVIGSAIGGSLTWLVIRVFDQTRTKKYSTKELSNDLAYFAPVSFLLVITVYYPTLYSFSQHLLNKDYQVLFSVIASQAIAFLLFLTSINLYRYLLIRIVGKKL